MRVMPLMSPSLLSGGVLDRDDSALVAEFCARHDPRSHSDGAMERLLFNGGAMVHPAGWPGMAAHTVAVGAVFTAIVKA